MDIFLGIDVACRKGKSLPICAVKKRENRLSLLPIREQILSRFPLGPGNNEIRNRSPFRDLAKETGRLLQEVCSENDWKIKRIAIDGPAAPPTKGKRGCEQAINREGLSLIFTPSEDSWKSIQKCCADYLSQSSVISRLPYGNMIWMLYGFELFRELRSLTKADVIEVYPYSIVSSLDRWCPHKKTKEGYRRQLHLIAESTGWDANELEGLLRTHATGGKHDRLDAFMAAWTASLPVAQRVAFGNQNDPNNSIWKPRNRLVN